MNGALLHLINVQYEDEGSYECETLNIKGMDWYRQWLYVEGNSIQSLKNVNLWNQIMCIVQIFHCDLSSGPPEWAEHINDTERDVGSELTMRCVAVGKPIPWIRWLKDGYSVNSFIYFNIKFR